VTVNSSNITLSGLAASINSLNAGVNASVIQDANGYRLALVSATTGTPGDLTVSGNTTSLSFTKAVTGTNASLVVDGIPISSASNTVSNVINGVTLNLGSPAPGTPVSVNVGPDSTQITGAINNLVSAYNAVIGEINTQFAVGSDGSGGGPLEADNTLRDVQSQLLGAISYSVSGNSGIVNLASLGVNLNNDGTLSVDSGTLASALSSNFSAVQNFLQNPTTGFAQNLSNVLASVNQPATGLLSVDAQGITSTSQGITSQIADLQAALTVQQANLTTVYSQVNATLQGFCSRLNGLIEGLCQGSRGIRVRGVYVSQGAVERLVAKGLPDEEGIGTLLDQQHCRRVLQNVGVLQRLAKTRPPCDLPEQLEDSHPIQLRALLRVEDVVVGIGLTDGQPRFQSCLLIEQTVALDLKQSLSGSQRTLQASDMNLLVVEVDVGDP
jgi:hypothetical protein